MPRRKPEAYKTVYDAQAQAEKIIKSDKPAAAKASIRVEQSRLLLGLMEKIVQKPEIDVNIVQQHRHLIEPSHRPSHI